MAENKQYIAQNQEGGTILISEDVIATIITQALGDIEGYAGLSVKPGSDIADRIGVNWGKGIKVTIGEKDISIDCNVLIAYGQSVVDTAKAIQAAAVTAVESMTGIAVSSVNVNVCGIVHK